ncbi:MAG: SDR family NAD(P)-dependent oxidoreductase [bacterium]
MPSQPLVDFEGRIVLVSGASSGIGRAIAKALSDTGARLILLGRNTSRLDDVLNSLSGDDNHILEMDLACTDDIAPVLKDFVKQCGPIYGLCHAAGVAETLPLSATSPQQVHRLMDVNLVAGIELARVICRRDVMEPAGGSLLFLSSIYGLIGKPGVIGYSATKGALTAAARSMAVELAKRNIRVNVLSPGLVWTEMTREAFSVIANGNVKKLEDDHLLRTGTPEDVAHAAAFLLAPQSSWITGTDLVIDGGYIAK